MNYRHWDHYVESILHPFVAEVAEDGTINEGEDILKGEPYECPMAPFGGIEQLAWSPDSKTIAYTCRKKEGLQYAISTDSDIYLYNIGTRETRNLCKEAGYVEPKVDATKSMKHRAVNAPENLKNNPRLRHQSSVLCRRQVYSMAKHGTRRIRERPQPTLHIRSRHWQEELRNREVRLKCRGIHMEQGQQESYLYRRMARNIEPLPDQLQG